MEASCQQNSNPMAQQKEEDEKIIISVKIIRTLNLQISKFLTVGELKDIVRVQWGSEEIPELRQVLFFNGNHLMNDKARLFDYGIRSNTSVSAYVGNAELLCLTIKMPSRKKSFSIQVKAQDTVQNVKAVIEATEKMGSYGFNLVYRCMVLEEEKTLAFLRINSGWSLYVILNSRVLQVSVKIVGGETIAKIQVKEFYTILDVRSLVESTYGYSLGGFRYAGMDLKDSWTVLYYKIKDNSIFEVHRPPMLFDDVGV